VRASRDGDAEVEMFVDQIIIGNTVGVSNPGNVINRLYREQLYPLAVQEEFHVGRFAQALDVLVAVPGELKLNFVLGVLRERIVNRGPAARPERQFVEVLLLREILRN
jgi:hypothetical protein